jgi:DNA-binding CsgD family transcriptional regulator
MGSAHPDAPTESLARARDSFEHRRWLDAFTALASADAADLGTDDLERLAVCAYLTGHDEKSDEAWTRAYERCLAARDSVRAAHCAARLGMNLLLRGDMARSNGWLARTRSSLAEVEQVCAARGLLLVVEGLEALDRGDLGAAYEAFEQGRAEGEHCGDRDVVALSQIGRGEALNAQGDLERGTACLDEAMVAVTAGEVSVPVAGIVYCAVLLECRNTFDTRRAREWTEALTRWCAAQPDLVPYRGQCRVHRSEVLQFQGRWPDALDEARRACELLAGHPAIGEAYYQQAEVHRVCGEHDAAATAYRRASEFGREPQPGLALLRLSQGDAAAASASIRRVVDEARTPTARSRVLPAYVAIELATGECVHARTAADELEELASAADAPFLAAHAHHAQGAVLLAEGDAPGALGSLRAAVAIWLELGAPHEAARTRVLIAEACRDLGDHDSAALELDTARASFEALGAAPDLAATGASTSTASPRPSGLTARECEVLELVAAGLSNHDIAVQLVLSDHTVRRHLQNIFAKTGVSSRAAATAFAFEHGLV